MAQPARRGARYADVVAASDLVIAEIIFGRLVTHRRGDRRHNVVLQRLLFAIKPVEFPDGRDPRPWLCLPRVEVHIGPHVVVPDVAAWRLGRIAPLLDEKWIDLAPEWVCEVLSPETAVRDRGEKKIVYSKAGVRNLWLVDPALRTLEAFELKDGRWRLLESFRDDATVVAPPFISLSFPLNSIWTPDRPPAAQPLSGCRQCQGNAP
ncbi:MAG TPA: Uma2 family endonuclease [Hyphomicrobiaceae bacterium]|nr:Uma2 family endonuclease [Hyphomicrobiaceae bacterium]